MSLSKEKGLLKAVARPIEGVARSVPMQIGSWIGNIDLSVVPMDDFSSGVGLRIHEPSEGRSYVFY